MSVVFISLFASFVNFPVTSTSFCVIFASFSTSPVISNLPLSPLISFIFFPPVNSTNPTFTIPFVSFAFIALALVVIFPVVVTSKLSVTVIASSFSLLFVNVPLTVISF